MFTWYFFLFISFLGSNSFLFFQENRTLKELILAGNEFEEHAGTEYGSALSKRKISTFNDK